MGVRPGSSSVRQSESQRGVGGGWESWLEREASMVGKGGLKGFCPFRFLSFSCFHNGSTAKRRFVKRWSLARRAGLAMVSFESDGGPPKVFERATIWRRADSAVPSSEVNVNLTKVSFG